MTAISSLSPTLGPAATPAKASEREELAQAAKAFEAIFVRNLIGSMRSTGFGDQLTGSQAVDQFREMSDAKTAESMAEHGTLGIAEMLLAQLDRREAAARPATGAVVESKPE